MSHLPRLLLLALVAAAAIVLPGSVRAEAPTLFGSVGDPATPNAFRISLKNAAGQTVRNLAPGTYTIIVNDYATMHNFHLTGPGIAPDQFVTDVEGTGTATWTVTFRGGFSRYHYQCDPHSTTMHGDVFVPSPPPRLKGSVGPGRRISLKTSGGSTVKTLTAGRYSLSIRDLTRSDNFHLIGPGVNKKTSVRGVRGATWNVTLRAGTYTYRSDGHRRLSRKFTVTPATT